MKNLSKDLLGTIVPVPSFYKNNLELDLKKIGKFLEFQLKNKINNFYLAMAASEFEFMSENERIEVTKFVSKIIPKQSILIAQPLGSGSYNSQLDEGKKMIDQGVDALLIKPQPLKENANFVSSKYLMRSYSPRRHDSFYIDYMKKFAQAVKFPLIYHDQPFSNGFGLSLNGIRSLIKNKHIKAFKVHTSDPGHLREQYGILKNNVASFDGFGKTLQFWTLQWGATARHSCWSWFEPEIDILFFNSLKNKDYNTSIKIINRESPIVKIIRQTGYPGYKLLMALSGLPFSKSRIPGENLNPKLKSSIIKAHKNLKKIKII